MFTIKLIKSICIVVFLMTFTNAFSQQNLPVKNSEFPITQKSTNQNSIASLFILHNSVPTVSENVTVIQFELGEEANVVLTVSNSKGELLETLVNEDMDPGDYKIHFKSAGLIVSGELTYKLEVKGISGVKNMFAVK
jgi:hypothetical protein